MLSSLTFASITPETRSPVGLPRLTITGRNTSLIPLVVTGANGQTADLFRAVNPATGGVVGIPAASVLNLTTTQLYIGSTACGFTGNASTVMGVQVNGGTPMTWANTSVTINFNTQLGWTTNQINQNADLILTRRGAANLQYGSTDAASPVAQALNVQSVIAGTSNTAGVDWTMRASAGTGNGLGGKFIFQVAPSGVSGTSQNTFVNTLTIDSNHNVTWAGKFTNYNSIAAAGGGIEVVRANGRVTAQTGTVASITNFTVGSSDATIQIMANVLITASSSFSFTTICAYTDEGNNSRTVTLNFQNLAGTISPTIANGGGAVPYMGIPIVIRCKAGSAIAIGNTGTFTSVTYNCDCTITQLV